MEDVSIQRTAPGEHRPALRAVLREYFAESDDRATDHFEDLDGIDPTAAAEGDLERLADPAVEKPLWLARDGRIVGTVQAKRLGPATAEMKRLYVVPARRGEGIGRRLAERCLTDLREDGFDTVRLGVGPYLDRARSLYEDLGFEYTAPYEQSQAPEVVRDDWTFMELSL